MADPNKSSPPDALEVALFPAGSPQKSPPPPPPPPPPLDCGGAEEDDEALGAAGAPQNESSPPAPAVAAPRLAAPAWGEMGGTGTAGPSLVEPQNSSAREDGAKVEDGAVAVAAVALLLVVAAPKPQPSAAGAGVAKPAPAPAPAPAPEPRRCRRRCNRRRAASVMVVPPPAATAGAARMTSGLGLDERRNLSFLPTAVCTTHNEGPGSHVKGMAHDGLKPSTTATCLHVPLRSRVRGVHQHCAS